MHHHSENNEKTNANSDYGNRETVIE